MKWRETGKERPPHGEFIWVWDIKNQKQILVKYLGIQENWEQNKNNKQFPVWSHLDGK